VPDLGGAEKQNDIILYAQLPGLHRKSARGTLLVVFGSGEANIPRGMAAGASGGSGHPKANNNKYFTCARCAITVPYHYHGRKPNFAPQMIFLEDAFVAFDPYAAEPRPLCVGSKCFFCEKLVRPLSESRGSLRVVIDGFAVDRCLCGCRCVSAALSFTPRESAANAHHRLTLYPPPLPSTTVNVDLSALNHHKRTGSCGACAEQVLVS
jgi:hypothetical protein